MSKKRSQVYPEIIISSSREKIWNVLLDFPHWNNFIKKIKGNMELESKIRAKMFSPVGLPVKFEGTICKNIPNKTLAWNGYLVTSWFFQTYTYL